MKNTKVVVGVVLAIVVVMSLFVTRNSGDDVQADTQKKLEDISGIESASIYHITPPALNVDVHLTDNVEYKKIKPIILKVIEGVTSETQLLKLQEDHKKEVNGAFGKIVIRVYMPNGEECVYFSHAQYNEWFIEKNFESLGSFKIE